MSNDCKYVFGYLGLCTLSNSSSGEDRGLWELALHFEILDKSSSPSIVLPLPWTHHFKVPHSVEYQTVGLRRVLLKFENLFSHSQPQSDDRIIVIIREALSCRHCFEYEQTAVIKN